MKANSHPAEDRQAIYYLESIARNLTELASVIDDIPLPSMGSEVLADNRVWLNAYIARLRGGAPPPLAGMQREDAVKDDMREAVAKAIYEADPESGYNANDPHTFWRAPDSYWKHSVWNNWLRIADAAINAMSPLAGMQREA